MCTSARDEGRPPPPILTCRSISLGDRSAIGRERVDPESPIPPACLPACLPPALLPLIRAGARVGSDAGAAASCRRGGHRCPSQESSKTARRVEWSSAGGRGNGVPRAGEPPPGSPPKGDRGIWPPPRWRAVPRLPQRPAWRQQPAHSAHMPATFLGEASVTARAAGGSSCSPCRGSRLAVVRRHQ